jgi:predicted metal-dependent peptidase
MKYCKKCNFLTKDNIDICTECNSTLSDFDAKPDIPVIAVTAQGFEKERICAMLTEEDIPFSVRLVNKKRVKIQQNAVDGVSKAMHDIIVPYEYYYKAMELLVGINAVQLSDDELDFVLMHEILHVALQHCFRDNSRESYDFNIACDIVVNSNIMKSLPETKKLKILGETPMHIAPDGKEGYHYTAEEVYEMLPKSKGQQSSSGNGSNSSSQSNNQSSNNSQSSNNQSSCFL